jgi:hypothetical protein
VYVSAAPLPASSRDSSLTPPPGSVLKRAGNELYSPATFPSTGAPKGRQTCVDPPPARAGAVSPRVDAPWVQVQCKANYPLSAIGSLFLLSSSYGALCSGSLFGAYSVITAAVRRGERVVGDGGWC